MPARKVIEGLRKLTAQYLLEDCRTDVVMQSSDTAGIHAMTQASFYKRDSLEICSSENIAACMKPHQIVASCHCCLESVDR